MLGVKIIVVTAPVDIVQCYFVLCGVLSVYIKRRYSAMVLCFEWSFFVVAATVDIVQYNSVVCGVYFGYSKSRYSAMVLCFMCSYCGYSNSRYSVIVLCRVWNLLWLHQLLI